VKREKLRPSHERQARRAHKAISQTNALLIISWIDSTLAEERIAGHSAVQYGRQTFNMDSETDGSV